MQYIDYSNTDNVTRGAQLALQAAGIKDKRKQMEMLAKFREAQLQYKQQEHEWKQEDREQAKLQFEMDKAVHELDLKKRELEIKEKEQSQKDAAFQAETDRAEYMGKAIGQIRRNLIAESDMPPDQMAKALQGLVIRSGEIPQIRQLAEGLMPEKPEEPYKIGTMKDFKEGDEFVTKKYLGQGQWQTVSKAPRYKPPSQIVNMSTDKYGIQKRVTASALRQELKTNEKDKEFYDNNVGVYNTTNMRNEVAYWDITDTGWTHKEGRMKFVKLPPKAVKLGWTPAKIQERAEKEGKTIRQVLSDVGIK